MTAYDFPYCVQTRIREPSTTRNIHVAICGEKTGQRNCQCSLKLVFAQHGDPFLGISCVFLLGLFTGTVAHNLSRGRV